MHILEWLFSHITALSVLGGAVAFVWSAVQFLDVRRRDSRAREFETYHRLVRELVEPDTGKTDTRMDRQIAVVFELRHFPRYYEVTNRILTGLLRAWSGDPRWSRLTDEMNLTLQAIEKKRRSLLHYVNPFKSRL